MLACDTLQDPRLGSSGLVCTQLGAQSWTFSPISVPRQSWRKTLVVPTPQSALEPVHGPWPDPLDNRTLHMETHTPQLPWTPICPRSLPSWGLHSASCCSPHSPRVSVIPVMLWPGQGQLRVAGSQGSRPARHNPHLTWSEVALQGLRLAQALQPPAQEPQNRQLWSEEPRQDRTYRSVQDFLHWTPVMTLLSPLPLEEMSSSPSN